MKKSSSGSQTRLKRCTASLAFDLSANYSGRGTYPVTDFQDSKAGSKSAHMVLKRESRGEIPPPPTPVGRRHTATAGAIPTIASSSSGSSDYSIVEEPTCTVGAFAGMTFCKVHGKYPTQYTKMKAAIQKGKTFPPEQFIQWVDEYYNSHNTCGRV